MIEEIKKQLLFLIVLGIFFAVAPVFAHPGNTDSSGCHTCRTNCANWGLSYGEYHCHNAKGLTQPEDPIRSHYGEGGTGYTEPWPDYSAPSIISQPMCPLFSTYNSASKSCECIYGYVVDGGSCIDGDIVCYRKHSYNSRYSSITNKCECNYGYIFDSSNQCINRATFCQNSLGFNAEYKILEDTCGCRSGYVLNSSQTTCINGDNFCSDIYGIYSSYNSYSKKCECDLGYELNSAGGKCIKKVYCPLFSNKVEDSCVCNDGYEMDGIKNICVKKITCPLNSTKIGNQCFCNSGYVIKNGSCITYAEDCIQSFGENSYGGKGNDGNSLCYCNEGFEWNSSMSACIKKEIKPILPQQSEKQGAEEIRPTTIEKQQVPIIEKQTEEKKISQGNSIASMSLELVEKINRKENQGFFFKVFRPIRSLFLRIFK